MGGLALIEYESVFALALELWSKKMIAVEQAECGSRFVWDGGLVHDQMKLLRYR